MQNNQQIDIHIEVNTGSISQTESVKSLGVFIDDKLAWKNMDEIFKKISSGI